MLFRLLYNKYTLCKCSSPKYIFLPCSRFLEHRWNDHRCTESHFRCRLPLFKKKKNLGEHISLRFWTFMCRCYIWHSWVNRWEYSSHFSNHYFNLTFYFQTYSFSLFHPESGCRHMWTRPSRMCTQINLLEINKYPKAAHFPIHVH